MPPIIISSNDSLSGNVQDTDLLTLVRSGASILTQRYDQFATQVRAGLATQGALSGHEGNQDAHYTPSQLVTALDNELGSADWRVAAGGGGLAAVSHDGTLSGDGSVADPLGVPNPFSAAEKTKLAGIETAATADQSSAEIVASITSNLGGAAWQTPGLIAVVSDATLTGGGTTASPLSIINPFSAAQASKLSGIETAATADQSGLEIVNSINTELGGSTWQAGGGGAIADGVVQAVELTLTAANALHIRLDRSVGSDLEDTVDLSSLAGGGGGIADGVIDSLDATLDTGTGVLTIGAVRTIGSDVVATVDLSSLATGRGETIFVQGGGPPDNSIGQLADYSFDYSSGRWFANGLNGTWFCNCSRTTRSTNIGGVCPGLDQIHDLGCVEDHIRDLRRRADSGHDHPRRRARRHDGRRPRAGRRHDRQRLLQARWHGRRQHPPQRVGRRLRLRRPHAEQHVSSTRRLVRFDSAARTTATAPAGTWPSRRRTTRRRGQIPAGCLERALDSDRQRHLPEHRRRADNTVDQPALPPPDARRCPEHHLHDRPGRDRC